MAAPSSAGVTFDFQGKSYLLPPVTQNDKRVLASVAAAQAVSRARDMAQHLPPQEASEEVEAARRLAFSGHFWWDEAGGWAWRGTLEGLVQTCLVCLKRANPPKAVHEAGVTAELVRAMAEVERGMWLAGLCRDANADPTTPQRLAAKAGDGSTPDSPSAGG